MGYSLPDFQLIWSNFLNRFTSLQFNQVGKGVDTLGGLPPPQTPPEGSRSLHLASSADVKADFGFGKWCQRSAPTITQTKSERDVVAVRDFLASICSKSIGVLTGAKCSRSDDRLPIGNFLPDFQQIWSNFKIEISELQIALNLLEFWRAQNAHVAMITYP